ncbi:DapH/DapD/GlmU-related protein [Hahella sp. KA22]|uniref:acyltransferase n=1 Tax=Hahella sp. KA22 TaxID=1628392 RepID=UPI0019D48818|nr:acyltransferase [Hahella sp. KA22]
MSTLSGATLRARIKHSDSMAACALRAVYFGIRRFQIPCIPVLHKPLYLAHRSLSGMLENLSRIFYWTPLFQSRLESPARNLYLYSGMPLVTGALSVQMGADCRVSGLSTFSGRTSSPNTPRLIVGDNVDIGWQTTIAVGSEVILGDNVRIAGRAFLAGYPGHPLDAAARAAGKPETDDQAGPIILEDNVWLATGVSVMAGVRIGRNTIVAAGSVVTRDLPANVLAGGVPALVLRTLTEEE